MSSFDNPLSGSSTSQNAPSEVFILIENEGLTGEICIVMVSRSLITRRWEGGRFSANGNVLRWYSNPFPRLLMLSLKLVWAAYSSWEWAEMATRYGPGIESQRGRDFPHPSRPTLGPTQPTVQWVLGISRGYGGRGVALAAHPHLASRLKKE